MYLPIISYLDIIRTNNLVNICWGKVVFYRCSVIVLLPGDSRTLLVTMHNCVIRC